MNIMIDEGAFIPTRAHELDAGYDLYARESVIIPAKESDYVYTVHKGDKISQVVIMPIITPEVEIVVSFEETDRGNNGFGSSGR